MRAKFPDLCSWTETLVASVFGPEISLSDAFTPGEGRERKILPWKAPDNGGVVGVGGTFVSALVDEIPVVGQMRRDGRMRAYGGKTPEEESAGWGPFLWVGSAIVGVGAMVGWAVKEGILFPEDKGEKVG